MNETVLITGGSSGIGFEFARKFAAAGRPLLLVSEPAEELREAQQKLTAEFPAVVVYTLAKDLTLEDAPKSVYDYCQSQQISVDVLVNNAGFGTYGFIDTIAIEKESDMIRLNILAVYQMTRLFLTGMLERNRGHIINVSSISAYQPNPGLSTYGATKSFVLSFSRAINYEIRQRNSKVGVTTVCPTPVRTKFQASANMQKSKLFDSWMTVSAEQVATAGYRAMQSGKDMVVPGRFFHFLNYFVKRLPSPFLMRYAAHELKEKK